MAKDSAEEQLEALTRGSKTFKIAGRDVQILQMNITQLGQVSRLSVPIVEKLGGVSMKMTDIPRIIGEHTESVIGIVVAASGQEETWVRKLPIDQFLLLCEAIWEVDRAFFVDHVSPMAQAMGTKMLSGAGLTLQSLSPGVGSMTLLE